VKRKKVFYPKARPGAPATPGSIGADARAAIAAAGTVAIDTAALRAGAGVREGDRVRIQRGLYAGELATVESVVSGVIPAAVIRTDAGRTRRVRAIDLVPVSESPNP
jgi:hypothetical protein